MFVQRVAVAYAFAFGGFFFALALMFDRPILATVAILSYIICYGLIIYKAAALAPLWIMYIFLFFKYVNRDSAIRFYLALMAPFYAGFMVYIFSADTANIGDNPIQFVILLFTVFRQYGVTAHAPALYQEFFRTHPHTYWSHISGIDYFVHYPYADDTIAIQLEKTYALGNYNSGFLASDAIEAYGYQALPVVGLVVGLFFAVLNTAARGFGPRFLVLLMVMPALYFDERPLATSLLTGGIGFLILYLAWMPRSWLARSQSN